MVLRLSIAMSIDYLYQAQRRFSVLLWVLWLFMAPVDLLAQYDKPGPATIAFRAEPSRIRDSNVYKTLGIDAQHDPITKLLWQANRIRGAVSLPDNIDRFFDVGPGIAPPFDFRLEYEFNAAKPLEELEEAFDDLGFESEDVGDVTYFYPDRQAGFFYAITNNRQFIISTDNLPFEAGKFPKVSDAVERLLQETDKSPAGLAIDVRGSKELIESFVEFGQGNFPPPIKAYLDLPEQINSIHADLTLVPQSTVKAVIDCRDSDGAAVILENLEGLIATGKFMANGNDPISQAQKKLLEGVKVKAEGKQIVVTMLLLPDVLAKFQEQSLEARQMNVVKQAVLSIHNYHDVYQRFPFQPGPGQSEGLSWRVRVLPFMELDALHQQFDLTQSWDSPANLHLSDVVVPIYGDSNQTGLRWVQSDVMTFRDLTDGTSNTIAFIYGAPSVRWTENKPLTKEEAVQMFKALKAGETMIVGMYDGSVTRIDSTLKLESFEAMLTPNGGEVIDF